MAVLIDDMKAAASALLAASKAMLVAGTANETRIPMIVTTTNNSMRVNPRDSRQGIERGCFMGKYLL
jgi:hypothetical protein